MAVSSVVITVEGVLQKHVTSAPIPVGIALYHGLANTFNILLVSDQGEKEIERWLAIEGLNRHAAVKYNEGQLKYLNDVNRRVSQLNSLRTDGYHVDLTIEPDPVKCAALLYQGFTTMNFIHHIYALPQWRPDFEFSVRSWNKIAEHEEEMASLRALDTRLSEHDKDYE